MKAFIDSVCVMLGNLLTGKPTSWAVAKDQAAVMRKAYDEFKPNENIVDGEGKAVKEEAPASPAMLLCEGLLNLGAAGVGIYLFVKVVTGVLVALPLILLIVAVVWCCSNLNNDKPVPA